MAQSEADVIIIGAGAAGLMCALTAARRGRRVRVLEHAHRPGRKILMSGGGRCNFTNLHVEADHFLSENPHFCKSALARFTPWDFIAMVEAHGIAYHEKEAGQLFCDVSSKQILQMLLAECAQAGVEIVLSCAVTRLAAGDPGFVLETAQGPMRAARLVLATGGLSIPKMGATGFAYEIAAQFGHRVVPTRAALVPFTLSGKPAEHWLDLPGIAHAVSIATAGKSFRGPLLITHRGFSGPAVLQISSYWQPGESVLIDWMPGQRGAEWLLCAKRRAPQLELEALLIQTDPAGPGMPRRLAQRVGQLLGLPGALGQISDDRLRSAGEQLKRWSLKPSGTEGYRTAEVTLGGISTEDLSSASMESRLCPGLHVIGEAMDVTGHLGGFNFQWAWASGHAAGLAV